jgi:hypothetical protein
MTKNMTVLFYFGSYKLWYLEKSGPDPTRYCTGMEYSSLAGCRELVSFEDHPLLQIWGVCVCVCVTVKYCGGINL